MVSTDVCRSLPCHHVGVRVGDTMWTCREVSALVATSLAGAGGRPAVLPRQPCEHMPSTLLGKAVAGISAFAFQVIPASQLQTT